MQTANAAQFILYFCRQYLLVQVRLIFKKICLSFIFVVNFACTGVSDFQEIKFPRFSTVHLFPETHDPVVSKPKYTFFIDQLR